MKFEALNLKDTFKVWKVALIAILIGFTVLGLAYVIAEWPEPSYDRFFGYYSNNLSRYNPQHKLIVCLAIAIPIVDIGLLIFIYLLSKWEKDAKRYGLIIDGAKLNILCEGQSVNLEFKDVDRFEVLLKNCEPNLFKSKWTDVGYIISNERTYKLYYLKNIQQAKNVFDSNKSYQQGSHIC